MVFAIGGFQVGGIGTYGRPVVADVSTSVSECYTAALVRR